MARSPPARPLRPISAPPCNGAITGSTWSRPAATLPRPASLLGWHETDKTADTPRCSTLALDKPSYGVGETMQVRLALSPASDARGDQRPRQRDPHHRYLQHGTTASIPVKAEWGATAPIPSRSPHPLWPPPACPAAPSLELQAHVGTPKLLVRPLTTLSLPVKITGALGRGGLRQLAVDIGISTSTRYLSRMPAVFPTAASASSAMSCATSTAI